MHVIKSVGVLSVAKIMGLLYGCMGLLFLPFFLIFVLAGTFAGHENNPLAGIVGIAFAVLAPVLYGLMGFVMGAIAALLYNLFAKFVGGFELEIEVRPPAAPPYPMVPPATPGI